MDDGIYLYLPDLFHLYLWQDYNLFDTCLLVYFDPSKVCWPLLPIITTYQRHVIGLLQICFFLSACICSETNFIGSFSSFGDHVAQAKHQEWRSYPPLLMKMKATKRCWKFHHNITQVPQLWIMLICRFCCQHLWRFHWLWQNF